MYLNRLDGSPRAERSRGEEIIWLSFNRHLLNYSQSYCIKLLNDLGATFLINSKSLMCATSYIPLAGSLLISRIGRNGKEIKMWLLFWCRRYTVVRKNAVDSCKVLRFFKENVRLAMSSLHTKHSFSLELWSLLAAFLQHVYKLIFSGVTESDFYISSICFNFSPRSDSIWSCTF